MGFFEVMKDGDYKKNFYGWRLLLGFVGVVLFGLLNVWRVDCEVVIEMVLMWLGWGGEDY